jgi:WD40 repeat protein
VTGACHAVKIVRRANFADEAPYRRELKGIQKYEPISRSHPGFVNILHVGHEEDKGYFHYLMELADAVELPDSHDGPDGPVPSSRLPVSPSCPTEDAPEIGRYEANTIERLIREGRRLSVDEVLDLGLRLTDALHCLHEAGLIHRDIKPSNLLFVAGRPKLADIGLVTDAEDAASLVGTPGYIPPEGPGSRQADIYALGKVLYECLTGLDRSRFPDLPTFFDGHPDQQGFLELNEIVLKACHPDVHQRYQTARQMHADLIAIENGESVIRLRELEQKLSRFKRTARVAAVVLVATGIAGFIAQRELRFRDQERQRTVGALIAGGVRAIDDGDYARALQQTAGALHLLHATEAETIHRLRYSATLGQMPKLTLLQALDAAVLACEFTSDPASVVVGLADGRCQIRNLASGRVGREFTGHTSRVNAVAVSPDGRWLASASDDGTARLWELADARVLRVLNHAQAVTAVDFHPGGGRMVTGSADGTLRFWKMASGELLREIPAHSKRIDAVRFNHSGTRLASASRDHTACLWDTESGARAGDPIKHANWVFSVSFSPDDRQWLTACADHAAYVWSVESGRPTLPPLRHERGIRQAEFSPDGSVIATAGWDGLLCLWDSLTGALEPPLLRHSSPLNCVRFSAGAEQLLTGGTDGTLRLWNRAGRKSARRLLANAISADGSSFVRFQGNTAEVCSVAYPEETRSRVRTTAPLKDAALNASGSRLWTIENHSSTGRVIRVWDTRRGEALSPPIHAVAASLRTYFDPTDAHLAVVEHNSVSLHDVKSGRRVFPPIVKDERIRSISFSPDASRFALVMSEQVELRDARTGRLLAPALAHQFKVGAAVFSPDSRRLITCTCDGEIASRYAQVWDAATGTPVGGRLWHQDGVTAAAWLPDGRSLITASEQGVGRIWSIPGGETMGREMLHREQILSVALRPNPRLALTASRDYTARLWDAGTGDAVSPAYRFPDYAAKAWFGSDLTRFIVQEIGGPIWVQEVDLVERPLPVLQDLADVLAGRPALSGQADDFNGAKILSARWENLRAMAPGWFSVSEDEELHWRRTQRERFQQTKRRRPELFQVERILRLLPGNPAALQRQQRLEEAIAQEKSGN